ncbi:MAG: hypothetical protein AB1925_25375 [Actinomycetota bacterium]
MWRLAATAAAAVTLCAPPGAAAQPAPNPPPFVPPNYGFPPAQLLVPGILGRPYGYPTYWNPIPPGGPLGAWDAAGVGIATNADAAQTGLGMPGSRLGNAPNRIGPYGPAPGVRTSGAGTGGISVGTGGTLGPGTPVTALEDPAGQPAAAPPPGNEAVLLAPALGP